MPRKALPLTGLYGKSVVYPSCYCQKKGLYLSQLDIQQKRCKVPNRRNNRCPYLLILTAEESKKGLQVKKEQAIIAKMEMRKLKRMEKKSEEERDHPED